MKKKWVKWLRDGFYKQGKGFLCRQNKFCCLGVLYDLEGKEWVQSDANENEWAAFATPKDFISGGIPAKQAKTLCTGMPPKTWLKKIGLNQSDADDLANMNDHGASFKKIATYIEEHVR